MPFLENLRADYLQISLPSLEGFLLVELLIEVEFEFWLIILVYFESEWEDFEFLMDQGEQVVICFGDDSVLELLGDD